MTAGSKVSSPCNTVDASHGCILNTVSLCFPVKGIAQYEETVGIALFDRMFEVAPEEWGTIFPWKREDFQQKSPRFLNFAKKFVRMLDLAVHMLGPDMEIVEEAMFELGASHAKYGMQPKQFDVMGESLEYALQGLLGSNFTPAIKQAWRTVFRFWSGAMIHGAGTV
jgi:hemoglobin-like flavoprotein